MSELKVSLFGKFAVQFHSETAPGFEMAKVQELFGYLLTHRDRPHARETLADLLWSNSTGPQSKKYLRQTLWQLQSALNTLFAPGKNPLLEIDSEWVRLNSGNCLWLDVAVFEECFSAFSSEAGRELTPAQARTMQQAVGLYRGDLLEGCYQDWCLYERTRLHDACQLLLDKLMSYCEAHHEYEAGIVIGNRILRDDCASERTHQRLIRLYYLAGDRTMALRQFGRCAAALAAELGVKPSRATTALYEQICTDYLTASPASSAEKVAASLPELLGRLKQIQKLLADVQQQVQQDIQVVEGALGGPR